MEIEITFNKKTALLFGASGLVGDHVLQSLIASNAYETILVFVRKKIKCKNKKVIQHVVDFQKLISYKDLIKGDDLFLCLGTTLKKAGSKEEFARVDLFYPNLISHMAKENKVNQVLLVSSVNANGYSLFFYPRIKGKLEKALIEMSFWATHILRPSILIGQRSEPRFAESVAAFVGKKVDHVAGGILDKYAPIEGEYVGKAMVKIAQGIEPGVYFYESEQIKKLGKVNLID